MCGIVGYFGRTPTPALTQRMTNMIRHRGPDGEGFHHSGRVSLGMRRLSIIDRAGGAQPIYNETGDVVVIFNGEVYNHRELRSRLEERGHTFKSGADTEVLVHGWEEWGRELPQYLNGMFAFAICDIYRDMLFIARDRLGIKPLYYTRAGGTIYFASEVKAFLPVDAISLEPEPSVIPDFVSLRYVPAPMTLFKNILKLPAGHWMAIDKQGERIERYWFPQPETPPADENECLERFGELFTDAVDIRLMSEVPLGAYLSAGLDSNLVVWAMTHLLEGQVTTYSIGFGGRHDETPGARVSASLLGTRHNEVMFEAADLELLLEAIWFLDEPIGDAHIIPSYMLAREAKKSLTVILLGEGADESLYGYPFYKTAWLARALARRLPALMFTKALPAALDVLPLAALNSIFPMPTKLGSDAKAHLKHFIQLIPSGTGQEIFHTLSSLYYGEDLASLFAAPIVSAGLQQQYFETNLADDSPDGLLKQINAAQLSGWLQDNILLRHDKLAMAHGAECRVPYLDHRLVEYLAGIPRELKVSGWKDKILSRRYAARHLPRDIVTRPKTPFFIPVEQFFQSGAFRHLMDENLDPARLEQRGYFREGSVRELRVRAGAGNFLAVKRLTNLIILELWHRLFIDKEFSYTLTPR